jgi:PTH1 family peptidyl-tRNA hydrolase
MRLVVGLGNPGKAYVQTRHNAGFMAIDRIAESYRVDLGKKRFNASCAKGLIEGMPVLLAKPLGYMNNSGPPVKKIADYHNIVTKDLLVIHDDIDLEYGRLKIKEKGGHGGHNGLRSLIAAFGGGDFARIRIGIGRSANGLDVTDHVLGGYTVKEKAILPEILKRAQDAVVTILHSGTSEAMNRFNDKRLKIAD